MVPLASHPARGRACLASHGWTLLAGVVVASLLYLNLFLVPRTPFLPGGDQVFFWTYAQRMLHGERPYVDFFQFTPPGADLLYLAVFRLFGPTVRAVVGVDFGLGVLLSMACYRSARRVMTRPAAAATSVVFVAVVYVPLMNGTHHFFSMLLITLASLCGSRATRRRGWAAAGACLALACFFTQTHGLVAVVVLPVWLVWRARSRGLSGTSALGGVAVVGAAFVATLTVLYARYLLTVGPSRLWQLEVAYVLEHMVVQPTDVPGMPESPSWQALDRSVVCWGAALVCGLGLVRVARTKRRSPRHEYVALQAGLGLALWLEVAASPSWLRFYSVAMPGFVVLVWLVTEASEQSRPRWRRTFAFALVLGGAAHVALSTTQHRQRAAYVVRALPAGEAAVPLESDEKVEEVRSHTVPGEFFFQAIWPGLYLPLGLRNPAFVDTLGTDDGTRPEDVAQLVTQLDDKRVRYILWSPQLDRSPPGQPEGYHLAPLVTYLHTSYRRVKTLRDGEELWERESARRELPM